MTLSLTFLGTGCSSANPSTNCLLQPEHRCPACADAFENPQKSRNVRYNTSAGVQKPASKEEGPKTILIDCGKTFRESVFKFFPQLNITRIDALILTHAHTDAYGGLDDVRPWFLGAAPFQKHVNIYCTQRTYDAIYASFPWYFPSKEKSSAILPQFNWRYIPKDEWERLGQKVCLPTQDGLYDDTQGLPRLQMAILDVTGEFWDSPAHFNLGQAILTARRLGTLKTLLTGFLHGYEHKTWLEWCENFEGHRGEELDKADQHLRGMPLWWQRKRKSQRKLNLDDPRQWTSEEFRDLAAMSVQYWEMKTAVSSLGKVSHLHGRHVRPAYDGLTIEWREWGAGEHGHWAHTDRTVREVGPHSSGHSGLQAHTHHHHTVGGAAHQQS